MPQELADASRLDPWLAACCRREVSDTLSKRHVRQYGLIRDGQRLERALLELEGLERLRQKQDGKRHMIRLNPALLEAAP